MNTYEKTSPSSELSETQPDQKYSRRGVALVPNPSDDPDDPLNWPGWRKHFQFAILCLGTFLGVSAATSTTLASPAQARSFQVDPHVVTYTISGSTAAHILGPFIFIPLARVVGMTSVVFWTLTLTSALCAWSGAASEPDDFISYAVSRGLTGLVCQLPQVLTSGFIVNVYFRHERGVAFATSSTLFALGTVAGATFSGFIIQYSTWPVVFWWLVAGNGLAAALTFLFVDETSFDRTGDSEMQILQTQRKSMTWLQSRVATFFPGHRVVRHVSTRDNAKFLASIFQVGFSPATALAGFFVLINFAWLVIVCVELPLYVQQPYSPEKGLIGYDFTSQQTALLFFGPWAGILAAQASGCLLNDRVPLWLARRAGSFVPEYRLYPSILPGLIAGPAGLALTGAALQHHLHYMVLAVGAALVCFAGTHAAALTLNYTVESFGGHAQEAGAALNAWRLALAFGLPFAFAPWAQRVSVAWVFGIAACLDGVAFAGVLLLLWRGRDIRKFALLTSVDGAAG